MQKYHEMGGFSLAVQTKKKPNAKATMTRFIALALAVLLLGSVLAAAMFTNFY